MSRRVQLVALSIVSFAIAAAVAIPWWVSQHRPAQTSTKTIDIQHTLFNRNDTKIGTPPSGYVYADFSLLIMNCGYDKFTVAPSLFLLEAGGSTYSASNATVLLPTPMSQTVLLNGQQIFGEIAYQIPANTDIPSAPLAYTSSFSYSIKWVSSW